MSDRLKKQIQVELEQLTTLLDVHHPLIAKVLSTPPDAIELSALAAMLHFFYSGIENIFKRVSKEKGDPVSPGDAWHRELLAQMSRSGANRPPVTTAVLRDTLKEYLEFRHVFLQAYSFQLRWEKMGHLVINAPVVLKDLKKDLDLFLDKI